jgi:hypothetical protein
MTLAQQLHNSATHAAGIDPACPVCSPQAAPALAGGRETIDITPDSLKTPEGVARINRALNEFQNATAEVANEAEQILRMHDSGTIEAEDWQDFRAIVSRRHETQETFLRAIGGR